MTDSQSDRLDQLLAALVDSTLAPGEAEELTSHLRTSPAARRTYIAWMTLDARLRIRHAPPMQIPGIDHMSGRALALGGLEKAEGLRREAVGQREAPTPTRSVSEAVGVQPLGCVAKEDQAKAWTPTSDSLFRNFSRSVREVVWHPIALVLLAGLIATAIIVYQFSTTPTQQPVAVTPPATTPAEPAARLVGTTDAKWLGALRPDGDVLTPGQRLALTRGLAEVRFNREAKVIFDGPAEFEVVDGGACRLSAGKLTAHCPPAARGFTVHTPTGTVTDLGTQFGVYVRSEALGNKLEAEREEEQEQPPPEAAPQVSPQPPMTEVHVFQGQVELAQAPNRDASSKSEIRNHKSEILSAGQAVTISENKVQPLLAADPFKFALDKLQGKSRTVLLSDDFESYPLAPADDALERARPIGPWIVQTSTRKGQGVRVEDDLSGYIAKVNAGADEQDRLPVPPPSIGKQTILLLCAAQNPKDTYPLLAHPIDGRQLTGTCQVLFELELMPVTTDVQPSVALAADVGHAPGIELWRNADAAAPAISWSRLQGYRLRVLIGVVDGTPREARIERSAWRGAEGWVRDASYNTPVPPLNWKTPPRYAIVGFPTVSAATPASIFRIDNVRVEVIAEK